MENIEKLEFFLVQNVAKEQRDCFASGSLNVKMLQLK